MAGTLNQMDVDVEFAAIQHPAGSDPLARQHRYRLALAASAALLVLFEYTLYALGVRDLFTLNAVQ
jgi:hypothetical protein